MRILRLSITTRRLCMCTLPHVPGCCQNAALRIQLLNVHDFTFESTGHGSLSPEGTGPFHRPHPSRPSPSLGVEILSVGERVVRNCGVSLSFFLFGLVTSNHIDPGNCFTADSWSSSRVGVKPFVKTVISYPGELARKEFSV